MRIPNLLRRPAVVVGALVLALLAMWSLAMPLMSSPDEPSHAIKAGAVVRGQLGGELGDAPTDSSAPGAPTWVKVPNDLAATEEYPRCFRFDKEDDASCARDLPTRTTDSEVTGTFAGQYPPLYYALVGWPSLLLSGETALYAMRLVSAVLCAGFLTAGILRMRSVAPRRWMWGVWLSLTPMCLFIGGAINPQAFEIAAAFSFWAAGIALARPRSSTPGRPTTGHVVQLVVSGAALVLVRTSGPLWAALIVAAVLVAARPGVVPTFLRSRQGVVTLAGAGVAGALAVAWVVAHPDIVTTSGLFPEYAEPRLVAFVMLLAQPMFIEQMTGNFGWLDTEPPYVTVLAWMIGTGVLLVLLVVERVPNRLRVALAATAVAVVVVPIALTIPTAEAAGIVWQGRYVLPLAVGVPLLAALALERRSTQVGALMDRVTVLTVVLVTGGHVAAFYWASRRYAEGADGLWATLDPRWSSPIGFLPAVAVYALLVAAAAWLSWGVVRRAAFEDDIPDAALTSPGAVPSATPAPAGPRARRSDATEPTATG